MTARRPETQPISHLSALPLLLPRICEGEYLLRVTACCCIEKPGSGAELTLRVADLPGALHPGVPPTYYSGPLTVSKYTPPRRACAGLGSLAQASHTNEGQKVFCYGYGAK
jgi:hypothetical protein